MVVAEDGFDLRSALHEAVEKLSAEISHERGRDVYAKTADGVQVQIPSKLRNYSFFLSDDQVFFKKNNAACEFRFDKGTAQHKRFTAFIELRDLTRELIEAMELDKPDSVIKDLQAKLNVAYDDFYKKFGLIHSQTNKRYFAEDVSYNLVAGLEKSYDKTKLLEKSDIFTKRTIVPPKAVEHVDTALEALTLSIAEKARVDFEYMGKLTGMSEDELKHDLTGEIFKIPHTVNDYQTASEYLSGDIRKKLREAEEIAEYDPDFNINVSALKQAMPEPLKAGDIDIKLGAAWLDPKYYEQFMYKNYSSLEGKAKKKYGENCRYELDQYHECRKKLKELFPDGIIPKIKDLQDELKKSREDYAKMSAERKALKKEADRLSRLAQQKRDSQRTLARYMQNEQAAKRKKGQLE